MNSPKSSQQFSALDPAIQRLEQLKPDQFEIYFERRSSTKIDSKNQEVESMSRAEDVGISIRLLRDKRLGFSFTTSLTKESVIQAVESAFEIAGSMPQDEHHQFHRFDKLNYPKLEQYDAAGLDAPLTHKIDLAKRLEAVCRGTDRRIANVRSASLTEIVYESCIVDSSHQQIHSRGTGYTASISCKAQHETDSQMGSEFGFSHFLDRLKIEEIGRLAAGWAIELLGAKAAPTLKCPAILRNSVVADLVDFISDSFSSEQIDKGRSMLAGKLNEVIVSPQVTLIDDGLLEDGMGTAPFDAEGFPQQKHSLIEKGRMSGVLYDSYYANKFKQKPTGSAARGIKSLPSISVNNLYLQSGQQSADSLLKDISQGVLITDLMGLHTANPVTGDFSLGASGILIENGNLSRPIRGFAVAGNVLELFRRITDVADDLRFFGKIGAPSVRLSELSVSGS